MDTGAPIFDSDGSVNGIVITFHDEIEKRTQQRLLKESEAKFREIFDHSAVGKSLTEVGGTLHANAAFCNILGYTENELQKINWKDITHPDDVQESDQFVKATLDGKQDSAHWEKRYIHKTGKIVWTEVHTTLIRNAEGKPKFFITAIVDITKRKQVEESLCASEVRYRRLFESAKDGILILDAETGEVVDVNPFMLEMLGHSHKEFLKKRIWELGFFKNIIANQDNFTELQQKEYIRYEDLPLEGRDGQRHEVEFVSNVYMVNDRKVIQCNIRDITERKRVKKQLQESEERFRSLYENSTIGLYRTAPDGKIILANPTLVKMLGYSSIEELVERNLKKNGFEASYERKYFIEQIEKNEIVKGLETAWTKKDGTIVYINESAKAVRDSNGKTLYYDGTVEDITERKRAEEKLLKSEEEFRLISENVADMIAVLDLEGKRLYNNPAYKPILGEPELLRGTDSFQEIHPDDREKIKRIFKETVKTGVGQRTEYRFISKDGNIHFIESQGSVIRDEKGNVSNVVVVSRDITEKKSLEQQFLRSQRMESIGTLAGGIAHDLNNVLAPIMLAIEILRKKYPDTDGQRMLETMGTSAKRGADIVKQVLAFGRGVEGERLLLQPKHVINEIVKIAQETFPKNIQIRIDVPKNLWVINSDPTQMHQVLLNTFVNARDAMPSGGTISISAENIRLDENYARMHIEAKVGNYVLISVADTGTGIPPEILDRIFEPFFTTKEISKGTGLGLSTVRSIVKSHGGFINVYSEKNKGTTFNFYLPAETKDQAVEKDKKKPELPLGDGELILVVDDERSIREITKETLEVSGYRVLTANDGIEAIAKYAENSPNIAVVITDMMMPFMDGAATIRTLKRMDPKVKIIAVSGIATNEDASKERDVTVNAFLSKPYTAEKLLKVLREVITMN